MKWFSLAFASMVLVVAARADQDNELENRRQRKLSLIQNLRENVHNLVHGNHDDEEDDPRAHLLVKYKSKQARADIASLPVTIVHDFRNDGYMAVAIPKDNLEDVLQKFEEDDNIDTVEEDSVWDGQGIFESEVTVDQLRSEQKLRGGRQLQQATPYGVSLAQGDQVSVGSADKPKVCIVDTGVAYGHPDISTTKTWGASRNFSADNARLLWHTDKRGHGTHLAGIVAARTDNNVGVRGMGDIELYITRGLSDSGTARESDVVDAMGQCEQAGAKIINLSLSGSSMATSTRNMIDRLYSNGYLIFAAAGNQSSNMAAWPAAYSRVISVTAVTDTGDKWKGSNWHNTIELAAGGNLITSTGISANGSYTYTRYSGVGHFGIKLIIFLFCANS
jgi:subtilisin family serine protease